MQRSELVCIGLSGIEVGESCAVLHCLRFREPNLEEGTFVHRPCVVASHCYRSFRMHPCCAASAYLRDLGQYTFGLWSCKAGTVHPISCDEGQQDRSQRYSTSSRSSSVKSAGGGCVRLAQVVATRQRPAKKAPVVLQCPRCCRLRGDSAYSTTSACLARLMRCWTLSVMLQLGRGT